MNALLTRVMLRPAQVEGGEPSPLPQPARAVRFGDALRVHVVSDAETVSPSMPTQDVGVEQPVLSPSYDELSSYQQAVGAAAFVASTMQEPVLTHDVPVQSASAESSDTEPQEPVLTVIPQMSVAVTPAYGMAARPQSVPTDNGSDERVVAAFANKGDTTLSRPVPLRAITSGERVTSGATVQAMNLLQTAASVNLSDTRATAPVHLLATGTAPATVPMSNGVAESTPHVQLAQSQSVLASAMPQAAGIAQAAGIERAIETLQIKPDSHLAAESKPALAQALGERLHVQINRGVSHAVIRLDPPNLGTIEIVIRHEGGSVQVHMSASHGDVLRQLHGIGNALTQDLIQRNHGDVTVYISESSREADGRERQRHGSSHEEEGARPGRAWSEPEDSDRPVAFTLARAQE
jgi:flagellar hook-length control protein FliK